MPFNIRGPEILIILVIVIVLFGVGRIGKISTEVAKGLRGFRASLSGDAKPAPDEKKL